MPELNQVVWSARSYCETCKWTVYTSVTIPEDRRIGLPTKHSCGEKMKYQSSDTSDFGQLVWGELTRSLTFYDDDDVVEITLGEENV